MWPVGCHLVRCRIESHFAVRQTALLAGRVWVTRPLTACVARDARLQVDNTLCGTMGDNGGQTGMVLWAGVSFASSQPIRDCLRCLFAAPPDSFASLFGCRLLSANGRWNGAGAAIAWRRLGERSGAAMSGRSLLAAAVGPSRRPSMDL